MANNIIFTDGFDHYTSTLDKWDISSFSAPTGATVSAPTIVQGVGRGGAGALYLATGTTSALAGATSYLQKNLGAQGQLYVGFAYSFNPTQQTTDTPILSFTDGSTVQVQLLITSSGVLYFTRGGPHTVVLIGPSSSVSLPANSFHYLEAFVSFSATTGAVTLKLDQTTIITATGLNTIISANAYCAALQVGQAFFATNTNFTGPLSYYDDIYIDTLGFNGDNRVAGLLPTGNGSANVLANNVVNWPASTVMAVGYTFLDSNSNLQRVVAVTGDAKTGSSAPTWATTVGVNTTDNHVTVTCLGAVSQYKLVNEPNPDDDYSYISTNTIGDISRFTYPAISGPAIKTVVPWFRARKDDGGYRAIQASTKSGGTVYTSGTDVPLGGNYQYLPIFLPIDPATGIAWTDAGINAAEYGVKLTG